MNRVRIGIYLISQALKYHGTDKFWDVISWWHSEVHYTIPRIREEKIIAMSLTETFSRSDYVISTGDTSNLYVSTDTSIINRNFSKEVGYLCVNDPAGSWSFGDWGIQCSKRPNFVRRALVNLALGFKWEDSEETERTKENRAEYLRLQEFLES